MQSSRSKEIDTYVGMLVARHQVLGALMMGSAISVVMGLMEMTWADNPENAVWAISLGGIVMICLWPTFQSTRKNLANFEFRAEKNQNRVKVICTPIPAVSPDLVPSDFIKDGQGEPEPVLLAELNYWAKRLPDIDQTISMMRAKGQSVTRAQAVNLIIQAQSQVDHLNRGEFLA